MRSRTAARTAMAKRVLKKLDKEAEQVVESFAKAGETAVDATMSFIEGELRKSVPLMYHLSGMLRSQELVDVLSGRLNQTPDGEGCT